MSSLAACGGEKRSGGLAFDEVEPAGRERSLDRCGDVLVVPPRCLTVLFEATEPGGRRLGVDGELVSVGGGVDVG